MSLSAADIAAIEFWSGEILEEDEEALDGLAVLYGSPYGAALHVLHRDLADFARSPETVGAGSDRVSSGKSPAWLEAQISKLIRFVRGSDSVTVTEAFEVLLSSVEAGGVEYMSELTVVAVNARRA